MGQSWEIYNADCRQKMGGCKLGEQFFESWGGLYNRLLVFCLPPGFDKLLKGGRKISQPGRLANLPEEILRNIFKEPDFGFIDLVFIASTCKSLLIAAMPLMQPLLQDIHGPWAKGRIICLGEYTDVDEDLPAGFLTDAEKHEAATTHIPGLGDPGEYTPCYASYACERYEPECPSPYRRRKRSVEDTRINYHALHDRLRQFVKMRTVEPAVRAQDLALFDVLYGAALSPSFRRGERALFNITKGECVHEDGLRPMALDSYGTLANLAHALLSRICWSTDPSCSMYLEDWLVDELMQGPWAGDRFCIATMDEMPLTPMGEVWKDVTVDVDAFLWHVWRHEHKGDALCRKEFKGVLGGDASTAAERERKEEAEAEAEAKREEEAEAMRKTQEAAAKRKREEYEEDAIEEALAFRDRYNASLMRMVSRKP